MVIKYATQWDAHGLDGGNNMSETPFETIVRRDRKTGREREREKDTGDNIRDVIP